MVNFIRTVLIIVAVYYAVRFISRWLVPKLIRYLMKRSMKNFQNQYNQQQAQSQRAPGSIHVDHVPNQKKSNSEKGGDYGSIPGGKETKWVG